MKKLILLITILTTFGCKGPTLMTGLQQEQLYIDNKNSIFVVKRGGVSYYVTYDEAKREYFYDEVPYYLDYNIVRVPGGKHITIKNEN